MSATPSTDRRTTVREPEYRKHAVGITWPHWLTLKPLKARPLPPAQSLVREHKVKYGRSLT